ncbi:hypothetical protein H6P81_001461 [Aristolochia fimbriata]|uniref:Uncharacterized protein n=1 Tax=Aristolochia fimbriata TaxID=158543 RepID=A0AAV7F792_ARIFI|nr:hypothetical protein H6P81_001461 [Aristolochia fimbriata]
MFSKSRVRDGVHLEKFLTRVPNGKDMFLFQGEDTLEKSLNKIYSCNGGSASEEVPYEGGLMGRTCLWCSMIYGFLKDDWCHYRAQQVLLAQGRTYWKTFLLEILWLDEYPILVFVRSFIGDGEQQMMFKSNENHIKGKEIYLLVCDRKIFWEVQIRPDICPRLMSELLLLRIA